MIFKKQPFFVDWKYLVYLFHFLLFAVIVSPKAFCIYVLDFPTCLGEIFPTFSPHSPAVLFSPEAAGIVSLTLTMWCNYLKYIELYAVEWISIINPIVSIPIFGILIVIIVIGFGNGFHKMNIIIVKTDF